MIIISALAIYAYPRFFGKGGYSEFTYQARFISAARTMQTRAMQDTRVNFCFQLNLDVDSTPAFGPPIINYTRNDASSPWGSDITCAAGAANINVNTPEFLRTGQEGGLPEMVTNNVQMRFFNSVTGNTQLTGNNLFIGFNSLGRPIINRIGNGLAMSGARVEFVGQTTASVCIESEGYIHAC